MRLNLSCAHLHESYRGQSRSSWHCPEEAPGSVVWTDPQEGPLYLPEQHLINIDTTASCRERKHKIMIYWWKFVMTYPFLDIQLRHGPSCLPLRRERNNNGLWKVSRFFASLVLGSFQGVEGARWELCLKERQETALMTLLISGLHVVDLCRRTRRRIVWPGDFLQREE